jgi:hypothetical protein
VDALFSVRIMSDPLRRMESRSTIPLCVSVRFFRRPESPQLTALNSMQMHKKITYVLAMPNRISNVGWY